MLRTSVNVFLGEHKVETRVLKHPDKPDSPESEWDYSVIISGENGNMYPSVTLFCDTAEQAEKLRVALEACRE